MAGSLAVAGIPPSVFQNESAAMSNKEASSLTVPRPLRPLRMPLSDLTIPDNIRSVADLPDAISEDEETSSEPLEPATPSSGRPSHEMPMHTQDLSPPLLAADSKAFVFPRQFAEESGPAPAVFGVLPPAPRAAAVPSEGTRKSKREAIKSFFRRPSKEMLVQPKADGNVSPTETKPKAPSFFRRHLRSSSAFNIPTAASSKASPITPIPKSLAKPLGLMSAALQPINKPEVPAQAPHSPWSSSVAQGKAYVIDPEDKDESQRRRLRASTGMAMAGHGRIMFGDTPKPEHELRRFRSPSLSDVRNQPDRPGISIPVDAGVGHKSRRMSASLPDDFDVDTCELSDEYQTKVRGRELGRGATATVKIVLGKNDKMLFAVKEFRKCGSNENRVEYEKKVKSEFSIANVLEHPNIVRSYRLCTDGERWNHVMELCPYGELFSLVQKNYLRSIDNLCFFKQTVHGIAYLHEKGIAHRDIKLENLLLSMEGYVKITDFGVSEVFRGRHPGLRNRGEDEEDSQKIRRCPPGICGSLPYIAPEVLDKRDYYDPRCLDVWSAAIVLLTLVFRGNPWAAAEVRHGNYGKFVMSWDSWLSQYPDAIPDNTNYPNGGPIISRIGTPGLRTLVLRMLNPEPGRRSTIQDVMNDPFFKNIECCAPASEPAVDGDAADKDGHDKARRVVHHHEPPERRFQASI